MEDNFFNKSPDVADDGLTDGSIRKPTVKQVSILYSIVLILFVFIGFRVQRSNFYIGIVITEFVLIFILPVSFLFLYKYDVRKILRINKINFVNILLILSIMLFAIPVCGILNLANFWIITQIFGKVQISQPPSATSLLELAKNILLIGGAAAVCEETMFRGVIQRGFERLGAAGAILLSALLFGMMHVDFQKLLGTFLLGTLIGFIVYRTNSIFGGMLAHFTNNAIAVIVGYIYYKMGSYVSQGLNKINSSYSQGIDTSSFSNLPAESRIIAVISVIFVLVLFGSVLTGLLIAFVRATSQKAEHITRDKKAFSKADFLWLVPGFILVSLTYIAVGLRLTGANIDVVNAVLKFIGIYG